MTREITKAQIRAIHAALGRLGIDDETYRALLRAEWNAASCLDLDRAQASALLRRLDVRMAPGRARPAPAKRAKRAKRRPPALPPGVARLATPAQRRLIDELRSEVVWRTERGFEAWLANNLGLERIASSHHAAAVIEGLKAMKRRQDQARPISEVVADPSAPRPVVLHRPGAFAGGRDGHDTETSA